MRLGNRRVRVVLWHGPGACMCMHRPPCLSMLTPLCNPSNPPYQPLTVTAAHIFTPLCMSHHPSLCLLGGEGAANLTT